MEETETTRISKASSKVYKEFYNSGDNKESHVVIKYLPYILKRVSVLCKENPAYNYEDTLSVALLAATASAKKFDPTRGIEFSVFAKPRINGAVTDWYRDMPRKDATVRRKLSKLIETFFKENSRYPTEDEILKQKVVTKEELQELLYSLEKPIVLDIDNVEVPYTQEFDTLLIDIQELINNTFSDIVSKILIMHFVQEMNTKEIAEDLGLHRNVVKSHIDNNIALLRQTLVKNGISLVDYV